MKHFKKISTISHKYAINKPSSSYSPHQTKALETTLTVNETTERQRRSTIDSWTAAAMNQASMEKLLPHMFTKQGVTTAYIKNTTILLRGKVPSSDLTNFFLSFN